MKCESTIIRQKEKKSLIWKYTGPPIAKNIKATSFTRKVVARVLWDRKVLLSVNFVHKGETTILTAGLKLYTNYGKPDIRNVLE